MSFVSEDTAAHFRLIEKRHRLHLERERIAGFEPTERAQPVRDPHAGVKGRRKSKKDKLREAAARKRWISGVVIACRSLGGSAMEEPTRITIDEVVHRLDVGEDLVLVDARSSKSFEASEEAIDGAIRVPPEEVAQNLSEVPTDRPVIAFCTSPAERSSARVAREMRSHGFPDVRPLLGGLAAWKAAHQPTVLKAREEEPPRASAPSMA